MEPALRFLDILRVLGRHDVEYILVGGIAAVLEGAPIATFDLDIVPDPAPDNRGRLLNALQELNAVTYLDPAGRHIVPDEARLTTLRLHQLVTDAGPLDVLATIGKGLAYQDLKDRTRDYEVGGLCVRCLKLDAIIESKSRQAETRAKSPCLFSGGP